MSWLTLGNIALNEGYIKVISYVLHTNVNSLSGIFGTNINVPLTFNEYKSENFDIDMLVLRYKRELELTNSKLFKDYKCKDICISFFDYFTRNCYNKISNTNKLIKNIHFLGYLFEYFKTENYCFDKLELDLKHKTGIGLLICNRVGKKYHPSCSR